MKIYLSLLFLCFFASSLQAQKKFDLTTYTPPKGWKEQKVKDAIQLSKEDPATGSYCLIMLYKSSPGTEDAKLNFDKAWTSLVKENFATSKEPEMQPQAVENGWMTVTGFAPFEKEGTKGLALLVTASASEKMVNLVMLTNSNFFEKEINKFLGSVKIEKPKIPLAGPQPAGEKKLVQKQNTETQGSNPDNSNSSGNGKPNTTTTQVATKGFAFTISNFDDGWTSTVKEDWVETVKGGIKVLIHYPNKKADAYNSVVLDGLYNAWDILVAPKYSSASNMEFKPVSGWQTIDFAEADMVEKTTGKTVHVVFFKKSNGHCPYMEFITADKKTFETEFGAYNASTAGWEKMENMSYYNRFAVAESDLAGKWTSNFSGAVQYVNAYTGFDAGMNTHSSSENFYMGPGNQYKWDLAVASGMVGNIRFQSVKSSGKFSMSGNWKINFSDIEGKPRTYDVYFSCIKGLRILWINNTAYAKAE